MDGLDLNDYLPCYKKSECEASATKQLLAISSSEYPKAYRDSGHLAYVSSKNIRVKSQATEGKISSVETAQKVKGEQDHATFLTTADIFERLRVKGNVDNDAMDFCRWQLCPTIHAETVQFGIVDVSRLKPRIRKLDPIHHGISNTVSKLNTRASTSPSKLKTRVTSRLDSQRPNSVTSSRPSSNTRREDLGVWQEPPPPMPIHYSFKYLKHPRQYSDQYREMYTYSKMKEKSFNRSSFIAGVVVPRARLRCVNGKGRGKAILTGKSIPSSTTTCTTDPELVKSATSLIHFN